MASAAAAASTRGSGRSRRRAAQDSEEDQDEEFDSDASAESRGPNGSNSSSGAGSEELSPRTKRRWAHVPPALVHAPLTPAKQTGPLTAGTQQDGHCRHYWAAAGQAAGFTASRLDMPQLLDDSL